MLTGFYPTVIIIVGFLCFLVFAFFKKRLMTSKFLFWMLFGVYIATLVNLTFFPFPYQKMLIELSIEDHLGSSHNFIPFTSLMDGITTGYFIVPLTQLVKNVLLFIPLGFIVPILFNRATMRKVFILGFFISLFIESLQFLLGLLIGFNYRSFDVDDLIMNTIGTTVGFICYRLLRTLLRSHNLFMKAS